MSFFDRQIRIAGWNQERLARACVAVYGRDWLGAFVVWALASLGVGNVLWFGRPSRAAGALARWLLARPAPFPDCRLSDYPFGLEYGVELNWTDLSGTSLSGTSLGGAHLHGANLSGANLRGADLSGANLSRANCVRTDFSHANLSAIAPSMASQPGT